MKNGTIEETGNISKVQKNVNESKIKGVNMNIDVGGDISESRGA